MSLNKIFQDLIDSANEHDKKRAQELGISVEELHAREKLEQEKRAEEARREAEEKERLYKIEAEAYKEKMGLGVLCVPSIIMRWRSLGENSVGDGATKTTVTHLRLREDFKRKYGRLKRSAGQLLCGRKGRFDLSDQTFNHEIDCPECLRILEVGKSPWAEPLKRTKK